MYSVVAAAHIRVTMEAIYPHKTLILDQEKEYMTPG